MCPTHSVWVPLPWGLKKIFRKFTEPPWFTSPMKFSLLTGSIFTGSQYHAFTFSFPALRGMEISMGCDKSVLYTKPLCVRVTSMLFYHKQIGRDFIGKQFPFPG